MSPAQLILYEFEVLTNRSGRGTTYLAQFDLEEPVEVEEIYALLPPRVLLSPGSHNNSIAQRFYELISPRVRVRQVRVRQKPQEWGRYPP